MNSKRTQGFTLIELMVVVAIIAIIAAIAIPSLLRSRIAANEDSAIGTLRSIVTVQSIWRQGDVDRNTICDYWTADVSGFNRIERMPTGSMIAVAVMDVAVALADDEKQGAGAAIGGAAIPDTTVFGASLLALTRTTGKSGYFCRAMIGYAADPDGNGQAWTNTGRFGFQARPTEYDATGINTFFASEGGVIWGKDFGNNDPLNAAVSPGSNPTVVGWRVAQ